MWLPPGGLSACLLTLSSLGRACRIRPLRHHPFPGAGGLTAAHWKTLSPSSVAPACRFHLPIAGLLPAEEQDMWLPIEATAKEGRKLEREHLRNARSFGTQQAEEREAQEQHRAKLNRVLDEAKTGLKTGLKTLGIGEGECRVHVKVG